MIGDYTFDKHYELIANVVGTEADKAWLTMWYGCADNPVPARPVPPDWDSIVSNAPDGYWDERGGVPNVTTDNKGQRWFDPKPGGCGFERLVYVCVGVEGPKYLTCVHPQVPHEGPCQLSEPARERGFYDPANSPGGEYISGHGLWIPSPFVAGHCPNDGLPLSHVHWQDDLAFDEEFMDVPPGFPYFRIPPSHRWKEFSDKGYGGGELVEPAPEAATP